MTRFVIQNNLIAENDLKQIQKACTKYGIAYEEVTIIPFVKELPEFTIDENNIYYGSTTFINNVYEKLRPKGVFFDQEKFLITNYINQWGDHMLNSDAQLTTLSRLITHDYDDGDMFFIRPNADDKSFEGQVLEFREIKKWQENITQFDNTKPLGEIDILISQPYNISKEWRCYIVNDEIITASLYRENFKTKKSAIDIPTDMISFVRERINEYQPAIAFAIDIAFCGDDYYIIECGCINSVGLYHCDIEKLVVALSRTNIYRELLKISPNEELKKRYK
jgi:hypothetical protein